MVSKLITYTFIKEEESLEKSWKEKFFELENICKEKGAIPGEIKKSFTGIGGASGTVTEKHEIFRAYSLNGSLIKNYVFSFGNEITKKTEIFSNGSFNKETLDKFRELYFSEPKVEEADFERMYDFESF